MHTENVFFLSVTINVTPSPKSCSETISISQAWKEVTLKQQETLSKSDDPVLNLRSISEKVILLDREVDISSNLSCVVSFRRYNIFFFFFLFAISHRFNILRTNQNIGEHLRPRIKAKVKNALFSFSERKQNDY